MSKLSRWFDKRTGGVIGSSGPPPIAGYPQSYPTASSGWQQTGQMPNSGFQTWGGQQIPTGSGGGVDWGKILMGGGLVLGAGADIFGAMQQGKTDQANLQAQLAHQAMINGLVSQYMTPAGQQNPYASQIMNFLGMGQPQQQNIDNRGAFPSWMQNKFPVLGGDASIAGGDASTIGQMAGLNDQRSYFPPRQQPMQTGPQMYQYQNPGAASYDPMQLGAAPQVQAPQMSGLGQMTQGFVGQPSPVQAQNVSAQQIQMPGNINLPQVGTPEKVGINSQGYNTGQDGLLQMMNRNIQAPRDSSIDPMIQSGTERFDNSGLFAALAPQDQRMLDEQVNQLRGSAGSFGQRFGSRMAKQETQLRQNFMQDIAARNAGIQQQSFESAANRNLQGAQLQTGREQFFGQNPFQNAALQMQAAQGLQQGGLQQAQLGLGAQQFNVEQGQQAQQFNAQNAINAALASQGIAAQVGTQNAGNALQASLANQNAGLQASQMNQNAYMQAAMQNANLYQNAQQFNIGNQLQMMQGNQQAAMQAALANQGLAGQYGLANQNAYNQAGQFNANMLQQQNQFGAQQGNIYNQLMMSGMMNAAGLQNQQFGNNAQLLGILAGLSVPQAQVNPMYGAIGNAATTLGMLPMMYSMMGR